MSDCLCGEINARHCPVHADTAPKRVDAEREYFGKFYTQEMEVPSELLAAFKAGRDAREEEVRRLKVSGPGFYLHSDDNYYWTPEAFKEFQALKEENRVLSDQVRSLTDALQRAGLDADAAEHGEKELAAEIKLLREALEWYLKCERPDEFQNQFNKSDTWIEVSVSYTRSE